MIVACHLFEAYLKCSTKCFLLYAREAVSGSPYSNWIKNQNEAYRSQGIKRLTEANLHDDFVISPLDTEYVKAARWRLAVDFVALSQNLESSIHAVERIPSEGRGKPAQFVPIRFVFTNKLTRDDKLILGFDALALSETIGRNVSIGRIIHGDDHAMKKGSSLIAL